ncbi:MAG TPA: tetratricopeptide repeat protein [Candidatus Eisenbacteria bacterium]|nr:tetratricopeptide repeat protein [Candidatus Eisenbacteria bacterium]
MAADKTPLADFDAAWNYDHPDSTERLFRDLLPAARQSGDADYLAQLLTQIARTEGLQMKFDAAARTLDEAEAIPAGPNAVSRVRILLERGRLLNSSKRSDEAKPLFRAAWDLARSIRADGFAVDAAHMLGIVESGDSSVAWNKTAIDYAEKSSDPKARRWLGSLLNNLGWTYHEKGEFETALDLFRKALVEREAEGKRERIHHARWCVARALRSLGRLQEALSAQETMRVDAAAANAPDGYVEEEIGECLLALGRASEAAPHFAEAYRLLASDPWLQRDEAERLERLRRLGGVPEPAPKQP